MVSSPVGGIWTFMSFLFSFTFRMHLRLLDQKLYTVKPLLSGHQSLNRDNRHWDYWPPDRGWPLNRGPLNRGSTVSLLHNLIIFTTEVKNNGTMNDLQKTFIFS